MSSKDEQDKLRRLVQHVARAFYEPKYVAMMDMMSRFTFLKDEDVYSRAGLQSKETIKLMTVLCNDRLVEQYRQNELKDGAQRSVARQYWYINYTNFCNVVKWRVAEMRARIDKTLRNELDTKGYVCPRCKKTFSTLEADRIIDFVTREFTCDVCQHVLEDNENADSVRGSQDRLNRFNHQMRFIVAGLRASEEMVMPHIDIAALVKQNLVEAERQDSADGPSGGAAGGSGGRNGGELRIAGANGSGVKDEGIGIVMSGGIDQDRVRAERDKAAEAKKTQNLLPAWHLQSTISGDLTALGVKEQAKAAIVEAQRAAAASAGSDDALRGLGTISGRMSEVKMESMLSMPEDVKPTTSVVDDYYASLTNSTQSHSTPIFEDRDDFGNEEEDIKPDVSQLMHTSLNDYRKRARSPEPDLDASASKSARLEEPTDSTGLFEPADPLGNDPDADDPIVYVNGKPMAYSAVTEDHHGEMLEEEYEAYFAIFNSRF